jgi:hypothetical protein
MKKKISGTSWDDANFNHQPKQATWEADFDPTRRTMK